MDIGWHRAVPERGFESKPGERGLSSFYRCFILSESTYAFLQSCRIFRSEPAEKKAPVLQKDESHLSRFNHLLQHTWTSLTRIHTVWFRGKSNSVRIWYPLTRDPRQPLLSPALCILCSLWGLQLGSDIRKYSTYTGLSPLPARWDVRIRPTVSVITFAVEIHTRIIIKRKQPFVKTQALCYCKNLWKTAKKCYITL